MTRIPFAEIYCLLLLLCLPAVAQSKLNETGNPFIRNFSPADYDAHFQNWGVTQDNRGVMYFANGSGLLEYDGSNWRLIGLPGNVGVLSVAVASNGRVYVGAQGELGYLDTDEKGELHYVSLKEKLPASQQDIAGICSISITSEGVYYKSLHNIFFYAADTTGGKETNSAEIKIFPFSSSPYSSLLKNQVLVSNKQGLHVLNPEGPQWLPGTEEISYPDSGLVFVLPQGDKKGEMLIATGRKGFWLYQAGASLKPFPTELDNYIRQHQLYTWTRVEGGYLFGTLRGGIIGMDESGKQTALIGKKQGLRRNNVLYVFLDRNRNLWAGLNSGISYIEWSSPLSYFNEKKGLEDIVLAVDRYKGRLYVGAYDGLFRLPVQSHPDAALPPDTAAERIQRVENISTSCWDLMSVEDGEPGEQGLWAAANFGITRIDETPGIQYYFKGLVYSMGRTPTFHSYIFMGLRQGLGLLKTASSDGDMRILDGGSLKEIKRVIRRIDSDNDGNLWLSTQLNGLIKLTFTDQDPTHFRISQYSGGLPQAGAYAYRYNDGITAASEDKIYSYNPHQDLFIPNQQLNAALTGKINRLYYLLTDGNGPILVNTDNGTAALLKAENGAYYLHDSPFRKVEGKLQDFFRDRDGVTWMSTSDGLYRYDPAKKKDYKQPYNTLIRSVRQPDGTVLFMGSRREQSSRWDRSFRWDRSIRAVVPYRNNSLTFEFAAVFYEHSEANRFSWKLEGYETHWNSPRSDTKAVYTNLPEGDYNFQVKARNIFNLEITSESFPFTVSPPWYRSIIAFGAYLMLLLVTMAVIYIVHRQKVEKAVEEVHRKYEKCYLEPQKAEEYNHKLLHFVETEKPYLDPNLNLDSLAKAVGIQRHYISQILNVTLEKTFWEFINEYRVQEAVLILTNPAQKDLSILDVAFQAGFNSGASFNRAFKRHTGTTPLKYKKGIQ